jgi:tetratricopeptide (TPR) repeat protein
LPLTTVLLSWPATLWFYVKVLFWPVRPRAFADPNLADTFSLRGVILPGIGVCCAFALVAWALRWAWIKAGRDLSDQERVGVQRVLVLGACILVLPILLTLNLNALNPGDFLHGRYAYLPLAGLMLLLATGWHLISKRSVRGALLAAGGLLGIAFGVLTVQQESEWKDDLTVFTVAHEYAPNNGPVAEHLANAHVQIALGLDEEGRCGEAVPIFQQALQQYPQDWFAWAGLGECFAKLNNLPQAEESLRRAAEISREPRVEEELQQVQSMMQMQRSTSAPPK